VEFYCFTCNKWFVWYVALAHWSQKNTFKSVDTSVFHYWKNQNYFNENFINALHFVSLYNFFLYLSIWEFSLNCKMKGWLWDINREIIPVLLLYWHLELSGIIKLYWICNVYYPTVYIKSLYNNNCNDVFPNDWVLQQNFNVKFRDQTKDWDEYYRFVLLGRNLFLVLKWLIFILNVYTYIYFSSGKKKLKLETHWRDTKKWRQSGRKQLKLCKRYCIVICCIIFTVTVFLACTI
jgi:hypothetical protein